MKSNQVNKKTGRDEMYEMEWRIEFGSGHQPGAAAAADGVNQFNLAFAHRALFTAIKEEDPGAMLISDGARFKLPEEIPVEDAAYEAAFSPTKIHTASHHGKEPTGSGAALGGMPHDCLQVPALSGAQGSTVGVSP